MNANAKQLLESALRLPVDQRAELAARLIQTLDPGVDEDTTVAWAAEIQERVKEIDESQVKTVPWSQARRMIMGQEDVETAD